LQTETVTIDILNIEKVEQIESKLSPLLLAFQFRFVFFFRNHIDKSELPSLAQVIAKFSNSSKLTI
jgi:exportin-2 (importin alpha re-exporter)